MCLRGFVVSQQVRLCTAVSACGSLSGGCCLCPWLSLWWLLPVSLGLSASIWACPCLRMSGHMSGSVRPWHLRGVCAHELMRGSVSPCVLCLGGCPWVSLCISLEAWVCMPSPRGLCLQYVSVHLRTRQSACLYSGVHTGPSVGACISVAGAHGPVHMSLCV